MWSRFSKIYSGLQNLLMREEGQDLVEYALTVLLVAIGAVAAVGNLATQVLALFTYINTHFPAA
jgi:pilus assembly protein Flp/PilA